MPQHFEVFYMFAPEQHSAGTGSNSRHRTSGTDSQSRATAILTIWKCSFLHPTSPKLPGFVPKLVSFCFLSLLALQVGQGVELSEAAGTDRGCADVFTGPDPARRTGQLENS